MNVPVEAQSLSTLTNLLANPPQYPRNPTHEVREPLALYIVRVPGSKDVFLTPLKPPTKASISLEAIQSSLYYLHVTTEKDEDLKQSIEEERQSEELARAHPPIHRKPLPQTPHANYPPSERPFPPPKSYPFYQPGLDGDVNASQLERYTARGTHLRFGSTEQTAQQEAQRRPQGPRQFQRSDELDSRRYSAGSTSSSSVDFQSRPVSMRQSSYDSGHHSPDTQPYLSGVNNFSTGSVPQQSSREVLPGQNGSQRPAKFSKGPPDVVLIRRDPVSGAQWNVGSILRGRQMNSNKPLDPVSIEITTPGYTRFASMPELPRPSASLSDASSIKAALASGSLMGGDAQQENISRQQPFTRVAEYQQHLINNRTLRIHRRADSSDSLSKPPSPTKQLRSIYSFMSPWQGICTFSNGIDGRTLKCRHTLSTSTFTNEDTTVNVAELRFNLPWSALNPGNDQPTINEKQPISELLGPRSGKDKLKRGFEHMRNLKREFAKDLRERRSSEDEGPIYQEPAPMPRLDSDMDRLSLDLGREKAGGGFAGNSAKLGKLIIEDEGLKMCDLLVAACMGVWWQHYDGKGEK